MDRIGKSRFRLIVFLTAIVLTGAGCTRFKDKIQTQILPEQELYSLGMQKFDEGKWEDAVAVFDRFERLYVNNERVQEVRLKRADAYFNQDYHAAYILAKSEYQSFLALYPNAATQDYVTKQVALCSFKQMLPPNRDQTATEEAIKDLQGFLQRFPDSQYVQEVRQYLNEAYTVLAEHNYIVGLHYFSRNLYGAAAERFKEALRQNVSLEDPEGLLYHLTYSLARSSDVYGKMYSFAKRIERQAELERHFQLHERYLYEAKQYLEEFKEKYPQSTKRRELLEQTIASVTPVDKS
jgi:outer membrane protein assembly factor BamD